MKGIRSLLIFLVTALSFNAVASGFIPYDEEHDYKLICNGGDIAIRLQDGEDSSSTDALYTLFIYDKDAIFYFLDRSEEVGPGQSMDYAAAMEVMVQYSLPKYIGYYAELDGAVMWIADMKLKQGGRKFVSGTPGTLLKKLGDGYELTIGNSLLTKDFGEVYYRLGSKFFEHCSLK